MLYRKIRYWFANFAFTCRFRVAKWLKLEIPKPDAFTQKENDVQDFARQFTSAVEMLTSAMNHLTGINKYVDVKIQEVDADTERLARIRTDLEHVRAKNDKVISNFKALLDVE